MKTLADKVHKQGGHIFTVLELHVFRMLFLINFVIMYIYSTYLNTKLVQHVTPEVYFPHLY